MPAIKAIPPRIAHRVCPDNKTPRQYIDSLQNPHAAKKHQQSTYDVQYNSHIYLLVVVAELREPQRLRRIHLGHEVDIRLGNSFFAERLEKQDQSVGMQRISYLAEIG